MSYDFQILSKDVLHINSQKDFEVYLEANFTEIEAYFLNISDEDLDKIKFDIEDFLYDLLDDKLIQKQNSKILNAFLILLAEKFLRTSFIGAITIIVDYLPNGATKLRLEASKLYLKINDISKDYESHSAKILNLLDNSAKIDEYNTKAIKSLFYFLQIATNQFQRVDNELLAKTLFEQLVKYQNNHTFLQDSIVVEFFKSIQNLDLQKIDQKIKETLDNLNANKSICQLDNYKIQKETSKYSKALYELKNPDFKSIRNIAYQYIQSLGDPIELYNNLQRGEKIIDDENLLYKYLSAFGGKHKVKLYSAYDEIFEKLKNTKLDIIDWGCGQGIATILLLEYAKEKNSMLDIENITLIEPSALALSRGLLHIDVLKQKEYKINPINSDLDCLKVEDLKNNSKNKKLHLFSNILDIESFSLNNELLKKVSKSYNNDAFFVCVSPYRSDNNNNRLDLFYNYFDENFDTELISARDTDIGNSTRYEKVFEVQHTTKEAVAEARAKIKDDKDYHVDIYTKLTAYANLLEPTLNTKRLKENIENDPDYVIYKIRKVAEIITSKIFMNNGGEDESRVSQNDKIRYLSFEKKILSRKAQSHLHTIRTIGNIGTHDHIENPVKMLKYDAFFLSTALILLIEDLQENNII